MHLHGHALDNCRSVCTAHIDGHVDFHGSWLLTAVASWLDGRANLRNGPCAGGQTLQQDEIEGHKAGILCAKTAPAVGPSTVGQSVWQSGHHTVVHLQAHDVQLPKTGAAVHAQTSKARTWVAPSSAPSFQAA